VPAISKASLPSQITSPHFGAPIIKPQRFIGRVHNMFLSGLSKALIIKNATLQEFTAQPVPLKKKTYTLAEAETECQLFSRAPIPPRSHPFNSES